MFDEASDIFMMMDEIAERLKAAVRTLGGQGWPEAGYFFLGALLASSFCAVNRSAFVRLRPFFHP